RPHAVPSLPRGLALVPGPPGPPRPAPPLHRRRAARAAPAGRRLPLRRTLPRSGGGLPAHCPRSRGAGARPLRGLPGGELMAALLEASGLAKHFDVGGQWVARRRRGIRAVDGVSFALEAGGTLGLGGGSGRGQSTPGPLIPPSL